MPQTRFQEDAFGWAERLSAALQARHGAQLVSSVLFGSVARREASVGSDVDLLLVFQTLPARRVDRFHLFYEALEQLRVESGRVLADGHAFDWSVLVLTTEEAKVHSPLYLDMVEDARLLVDREGFFAGVLDELRGRLRALGSRRVQLPNGSWYWDLKPDWKPGEVIEL